MADLALRQAVIAGDMAETERLLLENPACIDDVSDGGLWIPYEAALTGNEEIVRYIVEYSRASFNESDGQCRTMLHYAVQSGNVSLVKYLTERVGLSPLAGDENLLTPYELAAELAQKADMETAPTAEQVSQKTDTETALTAGQVSQRTDMETVPTAEQVSQRTDTETVPTAEQIPQKTDTETAPTAEQISQKADAKTASHKDYAAIVRYFEKYCGFSLSDAYKNPILTGMHPDPSIVCVGDDFYMVNSSFIFFPCIPISHSKDLIHWEVIGHAITNPAWSRLGELEGGRGYWAPDISYYEGRFYITATYRLNDTGTIYRRQMVVSSEKPEGPYCEPAWIEEDGIDPSIFTDDDGRRYMLLNRGARIFEISPDGKRQLTKASLLYYGHQKRAPEGAHLLKKDGWYYLFQAEGGTGEGHRISVSRSKELFGIYEPCPYNPIMQQNDPKAAIQRCGHGKPVKTPNGEWYMVYLCGRQIAHKYSLLGRETAVDKITWTADGWPLVNNLQGPSALAKKPDLPEYTPKMEPESFVNQKAVRMTDFGQDTAQPAGQQLGLQWVTPREPEEDFACLREDGLYLKGSPVDLCDVASRNILLQRQTAFRFTAETKLDASSLSDGQDAGMTCYYDENTYLKFGIFRMDGKLFLKVQEHVDNDTWDSFTQEVDINGADTIGTGQNTARELVQETAQEMAQETVQETAQKTARETAQKMTQEIVQKTAQKTTQETADSESRHPLCISLRCETDGLRRSFSYHFNSKKDDEKPESFLPLGTLENVYYLCDEGIRRGKRFTGAMLGIYAFADGRELRVRFTHFSRI